MGLECRSWQFAQTFRDEGFCLYRFRKEFVLRTRRQIVANAQCEKAGAKRKTWLALDHSIKILFPSSIALGNSEATVLHLARKYPQAADDRCG